MERNLNPEKLTATAQQLAEWIAGAFKDAHLGTVAVEVAAFANEAVDKAERIRRPIWWIRIFVGILFLVVLGTAAHEIYRHKISDILKFLDDTKGVAVWGGGLVVVLITLEIRWKRWRALKAVNELRALVHIVDMHQLAKDQAIEKFHESGKQAKIEEYLHACTALLALLSKIGQLYVEHFPDQVAIQAVNDFEMIATGLSNKIWMKIISMKEVEIISKPCP